MAASGPGRYDVLAMTIIARDITGLVLAGGRGSRMGGVDKGLQSHHGLPLALHAVRRLEPQTGGVMINANRNLDVYRGMAQRVWPDEMPEYPGPLAGMLAGLSHCETAYLVTVPCDTPNFPQDLVSRLARGLDENAAELATAYTRVAGRLVAQPVFCLMRTAVHDRLHAFVASGQRKTGLFAAQLRSARVVFDDDAAFFNINTSAELQLLQQHPG